MTDLREKLADLMDKTLGEMAKAEARYSEVPGILADAIIAALPGMVKPLEWGHDAGSTDSMCSNYRIWDAKRGDWMTVFYGSLAPTRVYVGPSRNEAIAAANAHHRAAIMAALGVEGSDGPS